mgnify:FL=1
MADFRQGLEPMHPQGRNEVEDGADRGFLFPRGMRVSAGEETLGCTVAARGKRRSRPLPIKAIDEDVDECGWPIMPRRFGK